MKTIGLIGGMSWESTAIYYRLANELVRDRLGGLHSARIVMTSVDFAEIEELQATGQWDRAGELLAAEAARLEAAGADLLVLCTNTMHKVADTIEAAISIPLLHLGDVTADAVRAAGLPRSACSAPPSRWSRTSTGPAGVPRARRCSSRRGRPGAGAPGHLRRAVPGRGARRVARGLPRRLDRLVARGAQGVILGCTEIELLIGPDDLAVPTFPTTRLHVEAAVERDALSTSTEARVRRWTRGRARPRTYRAACRTQTGRGHARPDARPGAPRGRRVPHPG